MLQRELNERLLRLAHGGPDRQSHYVRLHFRLVGTRARWHSKIARKMMFGDGALAGQNHSALQHVTQLAHVPGPGVAAKLLADIGIDVHHAGFVLAIEHFDERFGEHRQIALALAQRRQRNLKNVQAVVQIFA